MHSAELLWTIQEERRRQAGAAALERLVIRPARGASVGRLVGWVRERIRVFRRPTPGHVGSSPG